MKNLKKLVFGLLLLLFSHSVVAQGWEKYILPPNLDSVHFNLTVAKTVTNDYMVIPYATDYTSQMMTIDTNGTSTFNSFNSSVYLYGFSDYNKDIIPTFDNHYLQCVGRYSTNINDLTIRKYDNLGNLVWSKIHNTNAISTFNYFMITDLIQTADSNFVALFHEQDQSTMNIKLVKIDHTTGNILWTTTPNHNGTLSASGANLDLDNLIELPNGDLVFAAGYNSFSQNSSDLFIIKTDNNGNKINSVAYPYPNTTGPIYPHLALNSNGEFALVGHENSRFNPIVIKVDAQLNEVWRNTIWFYGNVGDVIINPDGTIMVVGAVNQRGIIKKYDLSGNPVWEKSHENDFYPFCSSVYNHIEYINNNEYMIFGMMNPDSLFITNLPNEIYVAKVDSNGNIHNQAITGNVYNDLNLDCALSTGESILQTKVLTQIVQGTDTAYAITDDNGNYHYTVPSGTYEISAVPLGTHWANCPPQTVTVNPYDTISQDLALRPITSCPDLTVHITTPVLVRCFSNTYLVNYINLGTQDETGVYIEVELDSFLILNSSSIPYTQNGNIYTFFIGNLAIGQNGNFTFEATVDCNAVLGQTHCVEATIYPNQICLTNNTTWNGATIVADAYCSENDSVTFRLENIGPGNMTQSRNYYVIEDQVLPYQGSYQLQQGQDTSFTVLASGYLYQIQADQEITHPWGNNIPSAVTYGCNSNGLITNAINQFSLNDFLNFQDVDCQQNVGSYDPNDKQGFPIGYDDEHYITKNDKIEYLIRFQNTGTYTAFNVRVEDEIDISTLDLSTLQVQASSHDYELAIRDGHILVFHFNNIMLLDSNTNEAESHGFIRFKIGQKANNPLGTVIENSAAIFFDFNEPIVTNTTFHTIGENFIQVVSTQPIKEKLANVNVYPNPFSTQATFDIETNKPYQKLTLTIYNTTGQVVKTIQSNNNQQMILDRKGLTNGLYFYQIQSEGLVLDSGKLMVN